MTLITHSADCGNSPKNAAVEAVAIGLEGGEWAGSGFGADTVWARADGREIVGRDEIAAASRTSPAAIRIDRVATHGKVGAVSGLTDGEQFAHFFTYASAAMTQLVQIESFRKAHRTNG